MKTTTHRERFRIISFTNPRTESEAWRVTGWKRDGDRVRENFSELKAAECRKLELTTEWLARETETAIRATKLNETQLRLAEVAFARLDDDAELLRAVDYWRKHGRQNDVAESPRLDEAFTQFEAWLKATPTLRDRTKHNLRVRTNVFANSLRNVRVSEITVDVIEKYLEKRAVSPATRDNDRRAVSRFFAWCIERPRRWASANPCREARVEQGEKSPPAVLTVEECKRLLQAAEKFKKGRLAGYVAVCLFGGLRPFEARRLTWDKVNLGDGEIRLEAGDTKTKRPRVVTICQTLRWWLEKHRGAQFNPSNWRKDFDSVKTLAGYGTGDNLKPWIEDVMRHTAVSHHFRQCGSYGQTAEQFGNSEAIIKAHYLGRVTTEQTREFYALKPGGKGR